MSCRSYIFEWSQRDLVEILRLGGREDLKVCETKLDNVSTYTKPMWSFYTPAAAMPSCEEMQMRESLALNSSAEE